MEEKEIKIIPEIDEQNINIIPESIIINTSGTSNYEELINKPQINNIVLTGNKTLDELGIQPKGNYIEDSNYVHTDNNFTNEDKEKLNGLENYDDTEIRNIINTKQDKGDYALKSELPTKTSQLTNDSDYTTTAYVNGLIGDINSVLASLTTIGGGS